MEEEKHYPTIHYPSTSSTHSKTDLGPGRPKKEWKELSSRSKRRRVDEQHIEELYEGAIMKLRKKGKGRASKRVAEICSDPGCCYPEKKEKKNVCITVEKAMLWLIETDASVTNYNRTKDLLGNLPCYKRVQAAKGAAYPGGIEADERVASVPVPVLLHHTAERIITQASIPDGVEKLELMEGPLQAKVSVFVTSLVPLELKDASTGEVKPNSFFVQILIRIRLGFEKEMADTTEAEINRVNSMMKKIEYIEVRRTALRTLPSQSW